MKKIIIPMIIFLFSSILFGQSSILQYGPFKLGMNELVVKSLIGNYYPTSVFAVNKEKSNDLITLFPKNTGEVSISLFFNIQNNKLFGIIVELDDGSMESYSKYVSILRESYGDEAESTKDEKLDPFHRWIKGNDVIYISNRTEKGIMLSYVNNELRYPGGILR